jgi:hypothetical protein
MNTAIVIDPEFKALIPPLALEELAQLEANMLGFRWVSDQIHYSILPTFSDRYWIFTKADLESKTEEFTLKPTAWSRRPDWFTPSGEPIAFRSEPYTHYPPTPKDSYRAAKVKQALYIIQAECGGPIKVGIAQNPQARVIELQTGNPYPLRVIAEFDESANLEKVIHRQFADFRLSGEWFHESALNQIIKSIQSAL